MSDVTRILSAIEQGNPSASEQLLPLVYEERGIDPRKLTQTVRGELDSNRSGVFTRSIKICVVVVLVSSDSYGLYHQAGALSDESDVDDTLHTVLDIIDTGLGSTLAQLFLSTLAISNLETAPCNRNSAAADTQTPVPHAATAAQPFAKLSAG